MPSVLYEREIDRKRETAAMRVMEKFTGLAFKQTRPRSPIDFFSAARGFVCEHKWRNYNVADFRHYGGIWLEVSKYDALLKYARCRNDTPLFIVTLINKRVYYADVRKVDTSKVEIARRMEYRCEYDDDPVYTVPMDIFRCAGRVV